MADLNHHQAARKLGRGNCWIVIAVVFLLAVSSLLLFLDNGEPSFLHDPNLTKTTLPSPIVMAPMTIFEKLWWKYYELKRKRSPNPLAYSFNAGPVTSCSVHGLLNECMEAGGIQYLIEKNVAGGSVMFGNSNVLNGRQWIDAFEAALQTNKPEWWDPTLNGFRRENLVFLRYGNRVTLVLSKSKAQEYQNRYPALKISDQK